ncbi:MAG: hypothetical protein AAFU41_16850 [Pseudomonadota bacterium]
MASWKQNKDREARGATFFLILKIAAVIGFFAIIFLLGANPFSGVVPEE